MAGLLLRESDVLEILTMPMAVEALEQAFVQLAEGGARNVPRARAAAPGVMLHTMSAAAEYLGYVGFKAYSTTKQGMRFHVALYEAQTGEMAAFFEADHLGRIRTGAASAVATQYMARPDSTEVGIFGSGRQARTQLLGVCAVRNIERIHVYSPNEENRQRFAEAMQKELQTEVVPVLHPQLAVEDMDIVITATTSRAPVFSDQWLTEGTHLNVIGSNFLNKAEVDDQTVRRAKVIVCDSVEQCKLEAGEFVAPLEEGAIHWQGMHELADVVTGRQTGRTTPDDITLFKSVGLAIEDVAVAARVLELARARNLGRPLPW
jgi:alanine dehydrogenase